MELLLNLIWMVLALGSFAIVIARWHASRKQSLVRLLLALGCVLLLLFPIISASDDLHPSQALMEEATRRIPHLPSPVSVATGNSVTLMVPVLLLPLLIALSELEPRLLSDTKVCPLAGHRLSPDGRAPPMCCI